MKKKLLFLMSVFTVIVIGTVALAKSTTKNNQFDHNRENNLVIVTSFYPMYVLTQNLVEGIEGVSVINLTSGQIGCLHDYQLTTEDMKTLSTGDIFIMNGGGMESFLEEVVNAYPSLTLIDASAGIELLPSYAQHDHNHEHTHVEVVEGVVEDNGTDYDYDDEADHNHDEDIDHNHGDETDHNHDDEADHNHDEDIDYNHGDETDHNHDEDIEHNHDNETDHNHDHDHDHGEYNGHVWLNMDHYMKQIDQVANQLAKVDSMNGEAYLENATSYKEKISELKSEYENELQQIVNDQVIIFHDAFAYLAQQLGIEVVYEVFIEEDSALSAGDIKAVIDEIKLHDIKVLMVEEQYKNSIADNISKETNATVYVVDSLVTGDGSKDSYLNGMRKNLEVLKTALYTE